MPALAWLGSRGRSGLARERASTRSTSRSRARMAAMTTWRRGAEDSAWTWQMTRAASAARTRPLADRPELFKSSGRSSRKSRSTRKTSLGTWSR